MPALGFNARYVQKAFSATVRRGARRFLAGLASRTDLYVSRVSHICVCVCAYVYAYVYTHIVKNLTKIVKYLTYVCSCDKRKAQRIRAFCALLTAISQRVRGHWFCRGSGEARKKGLAESRYPFRTNVPVVIPKNPHRAKN